MADLAEKFVHPDIGTRNLCRFIIVSDEQFGEVKNKYNLRSFDVN
jgi:hypothetical protein